MEEQTHNEPELSRVPLRSTEEQVSLHLDMKSLDLDLIFI